MSNAWNRPRRTVGVCSNAKLCQSGGTTQDQVLAVATHPKLPIEPPNVLSAVATRLLIQVGADHNTPANNESPRPLTTVLGSIVCAGRSVSNRRLATGALHTHLGEYK